MTVVIGVDPHKRSHTATAIDASECQVDEVRIGAWRGQLEELLGWSARFDERVGAVESANGLGYLHAQQLVRVRLPRLTGHLS